MTYGLVAHSFIFSLLLLWGLPNPALAGRAAASELSGTLLSVSTSALSVQGSDGRSLSVPITAATWLLKNGLPVSLRDFVPGEAVHIRLGRKGEASLVCDPATAAALAAARGHRLTGTILRCDMRVWIIQPTGSSLPLPVCLSPHTAFSAGSKATAALFNVGVLVTVVTRGLANGLLSTVSVTAAGAEGAASETALRPRPSYLSGTVQEVRADLGLLLIRDKSGASYTVAVDAATRIKVHKQPASLTDLGAGMRLTGRVGTNIDAAGNPIATSLSASDPAAGKTGR